MATVVEHRREARNAAMTLKTQIQDLSFTCDEPTFEYPRKFGIETPVYINARNSFGVGYKKAIEKWQDSEGQSHARVWI